MDKRNNKRNTKKYHGKKNAYKRDTKEVEGKTSMEESGYQNDPSDYIPNEQLRKDIGSFSFNSTIGIPTRLTGTFGGDDISSNFPIGNIMSIGMFPYVGSQRDIGGLADVSMSAINVAGLKLYTDISAFNSKNTGYQPQNMTAALISVGMVIMLSSVCERAYGVAFRYEPKNRTIPKALLLAMGIDPDSLLDNLSSFRLQYNALMASASNIRMLRDVNYFNRCNDTFANIFYDKGSAMGQMYVTRPIGWLELNEADPSLGLFEFTKLGTPSNPITAQQLLVHLKNAIKCCLGSSTFNLIYTDIVNYVTKQGGELLGFSYLPELYQVTPMFSEVFMTQLHNMDWGLANLDDYVILEDVASNALYAGPIWFQDEYIYHQGYYTSRLLDFPYTDNPSVDDIIDALAYKVIANFGGKITNPATGVGEVYGTTYTAAGAFVPNEVEILEVDSTGNTAIKEIEQVFEFHESSTAGLKDRMLETQVLDTFDVKPMRYMVTVTAGGYYAGVKPVGNLNYWTNIDYEQLHRIFHYYFIGLFDVEVKTSLKIMDSRK